MSISADKAPRLSEPSTYTDVQEDVTYNHKDLWAKEAISQKREPDDKQSLDDDFFLLLCAFYGPVFFPLGMWIRKQLINVSMSRRKTCLMTNTYLGPFFRSYVE